MRPLTHGLAAAVAAVLALAAAPAARAAWPPDPAVNFPICTSANDQSAPVAVSDGAGGAIVAWTDDRNGAGAADIYAQRLDALGNEVWTPGGIAIRTGGGHQYGVAIATDDAGGAFIAWSDNSNGAGDQDLWMQHVTASGTLLYPSIGYEYGGGSGDQTNPALAPDGNGNVIIVWTDTRTSATPDIYAQLVYSGGTPQWGLWGVPICTASNTQFTNRIAPDGAGGAVICWLDLRGSDEDVYAQRVDGAGTVLWAANGVAVTTAVNEQIEPQIVSDGVGGAIIVWTDNRNANYDIYGQHLDARGYPFWGISQLAICTNAQAQDQPAAVSDGAGGAVVCWRDQRATNAAIYGQRVTGGGAFLWDPTGLAVHYTTFSDAASPAVVSDGGVGGVAAWQETAPGGYDVYAQRPVGPGQRAWLVSGDLAVSTAAGDQTAPAVVSDGRGGALAFWPDSRNGNLDIYGERIEHLGRLGNPEPAITSITDVPADQGGAVTVGWTPSYLDIVPPTLIDDYRVWRSAPPQVLAAGVLGLAGRTTLDPEEAAATGKFLLTPQFGQSYAWELAGTVTAAGPPAEYTFTAATTSDSVAAPNPLTAFMIQARTGTGQGADSWFSFPDSGYSVDNLSPAMPAPLTGTYDAGVARLHWNPNLETDLAGYRIYRDVSANFTPGPGNFLDAKTDTGYVDNAGSAYFYRVTAVDIHGNESPAAAWPGDAGAVPDSRVTAYRLEAPVPNPARSATALVFTLPEEGNARLEIFDMSGRRVKLLFEGAVTAGQHLENFRLADDAGRPLASGVYMVRLVTDARALTRRLVVVR